MDEEDTFGWMKLSVRSTAVVCLAAGLLLGGAGGWFTQLSVMERHLVNAEAVNAEVMLRVVKALRDNDPDGAMGWLRVGLVGNVVVLDAWAGEHPPGSQELPVRALRKIAVYDAEAEVFERNPEYLEFFEVLNRYVKSDQDR